MLKIQYLLKLSLTFSLLYLFYSPNVLADEKWVIGDIRISGLQRVSAGSIFAVIPTEVGDQIDSYDIRDVAKALFKTGQFDDIQMGREDNTLIISLVERPSISSIELISIE